MVEVTVADEKLEFSAQDLGRLALHLEQHGDGTHALGAIIDWVKGFSLDHEEALSMGVKVLEGYMEEGE